ncbi:segregation/condensation protein A [Telmatocola sphagniphila]|uniref:Segregation and condensation protein A n=1 Tax=Telmatocola sphagniphila TaxID=1123043 RepID=A0A8E6B7K3_9BACT|nr:segregation/condensation protein A [Telmatocola sphagniphila]QVL32822.1 segregation/condensation protein A [Telmatocola sphagniphila]
MDSTDFQIRLQTFTGPFDLLLHLVKRNEIDLREVSIAGIANQFFEHIRILKWLDFELAGDFLVVAATLMEIKSRQLLPRGESTEDSPIEEEKHSLVQQLIEYRRIKKAASLLEIISSQQSKKLARQAIPEEESLEASTSLQKVEIWDLLNSFGKLIREWEEKNESQTIVDEMPQAFFEDSILTRLNRQAPISFESIFETPRTKMRLIGFFLALLELAKQQKIALYFGENEAILLDLVRPPEFFHGSKIEA